MRTSTSLQCISCDAAPEEQTNAKLAEEMKKRAVGLQYIGEEVKLSLLWYSCSTKSSLCIN